MKLIKIIEAGNTKIVPVKMLYNTYGPLALAGGRLDQLRDVVLVADSTTSTFEEKGNSESKARTGSVIGRSLVGGLLVGGVGAVVGGTTAGRSDSFTSVTQEKKSYNFTLSLEWKDGTRKIASVDNPQDLEWLMSFLGSPEMSEEEIHVQKEKAKSLAALAAIDNEAQAEVDIEAPPLKVKNSSESYNTIITAILWAGIILVIAIFVYGGFLKAVITFLILVGALFFYIRKKESLRYDAYIERHALRQQLLARKIKEKRENIAQEFKDPNSI